MGFEKRKNQSVKESTQYTAQSVSVLKSASHKYVYLSPILSLIVLFVQIASSVATVHLSLHRQNVE